MGVQDSVATTNAGRESSPTSSANTNHAPDKPLMLVALSATEAVGWEDLEAKVSNFWYLADADPPGFNTRRSPGKRIDRTPVPPCQQAS